MVGKEYYIGNLLFLKRLGACLFRISLNRNILLQHSPHLNIRTTDSNSLTTVRYLSNLY